MIRQLRKRPLLALTALAGFFFSAASEARGVEPCPYHDGLPQSIAAAEDATALTAAPSKAGHAEGHGDPAVAPAADHGSQASSPHGSDHAGCSCMGECSTASAPLLSRAVSLPFAVPVLPSLVPQPSAESSFSHRSGGLYLRYLPTAPPLSH